MYKLTTDAQSDLIQIRKYTLIEWGKKQSELYLSKLQQTITLLSESPEMGKKRPDVLDGVFSFPYYSHVIYYVVHDELLVFAVLHKGMVPKNHLESRVINEP
ncbi:MAG: type II toxin-antitoxin system RelE/ParE family toxin [Gammaproteobacteria bacterium]|nr:type II toxin-antitoxin system RelE/ParE family toxin [Gammaproteobacteria bacterium]